MLSEGRDAPRGTTGNHADIDRTTLAHTLNLARAVDALLAAGLADQARPVLAQLVAALEPLAGDGAAVVSLAAARGRRGGSKP